MTNITHLLLSKVKDFGKQIEYQLNTSIQQAIDHAEVLARASNISKIIATVINLLQQTIEVISVPFNIATKLDVTDATKMIIQLEEKVDSIETQLAEVIGILNKTEQPEQIPSIVNETVEHLNGIIEQMKQEIAQAKLNKQI